MLVTFKSKAAAKVLMVGEHAKPILDLLHKELPLGVITAAETGEAISTLEAEIAHRRAQTQAAEKLRHDIKTLHHEDDEDDDDDEGKNKDPVHVDFATRVYPLLEMLRAAKKSGDDVLWGV
jgi:hypothetical protein